MKHDFGISLVNILLIVAGIGGVVLAIVSIPTSPFQALSLLVVAGLVLLVPPWCSIRARLRHRDAQAIAQSKSADAERHRAARWFIRALLAGEAFLAAWTVLPTSEGQHAILPQSAERALDFDETTPMQILEKEDEEITAADRTFLTMGGIKEDGDTWKELKKEREEIERLREASREMSPQLTEELAKSLSGRVVGVADGDTITILADKQEIKIRLYGIDCPENPSSAQGRWQAKECVTAAWAFCGGAGGGKESTTGNPKAPCDVSIGMLQETEHPAESKPGGVVTADGSSQRKSGRLQDSTRLQYQ